MTVLLPGDVVQLPTTSASASSSSTLPAIRLGPGLLWPSEEAKAAGSSSSSSASGSTSRLVLATQAGLLGSVDEKGKGKAASTAGGDGAKQQGWWIESRTQRYHPTPRSPILAQITARNADFYTLTLHTSPHPITLPVLAFEGATKRHRPNLKIGALVYGIVVTGGEGLEAEMSCVDATTGKGEGMGALDAGMGNASGAAAGAASASGSGTAASVSGLISISLPLARSLLRPSHPLLPLLAQHFPFESAVGANGFVWLKVERKEHLVAARLVLEAADRVGSEGVGGGGEDGEEEVGKEGRTLSARWGAGLGEKEVREIVRGVMKGRS